MSSETIQPMKVRSNAYTMLTLFSTVALLISVAIAVGILDSRYQGLDEAINGKTPDSAESLFGPTPTLNVDEIKSETQRSTLNVLSEQLLRDDFKNAAGASSTVAPATPAAPAAPAAPVAPAAKTEG